MVLVDSSVWIETFKRKNPIRLDKHVDLDDVATCLPVIQEVLQGFRDESAYRIARDGMCSLTILDSPIDAAVIGQAVDLYRSAHRTGLTIRSSVDCLIAAVALRHGALVLHRERDFPAIARISALVEREI